MIIPNLLLLVINICSILTTGHGIQNKLSNDQTDVLGTLKQHFTDREENLRTKNLAVIDWAYSHKQSILNFPDEYTGNVRDYKMYTNQTLDSDDGSLGKQEDEDTFASGVESINELSKDTKIHITDSKYKMKNTKKKKKKKSHTINDIDLKYLQKLFNGKNVHKFHKLQNKRINEKALKQFHDSLYTNDSHNLKLLEGFDRTKNTTSDHLDKAVKDLLRDEAANIRYKIQFPLFYHSVGTITMPYDDLVEPFEAWYAGELNMSRIDYYQGKWRHGL